MPELPDVEVFGQRVRTHGLDRRIRTVDVRDADRLRGVTTRELEKALGGRAFTAVHRHGKVLFVQIGEGGPYLVIHFGMTGLVAFYEDPADEPKHARLVLGFEDGGWFAFDNQRRFGWLELTDDFDAYLRTESIGPDALAFDVADLRGLLGRKRGMIKPALMDQSKIAGIGNVYSDEILFQARVRPDRQAAALCAREVEAVHERVRAVLREAADHGADPERLPGDWLTPHRDTDDPCPRCGRRLENTKISGRTAWFCPHCQH